MATDSNRVRSGPRLVTSVNRNQIDTGAQFSVILGTGANLHNYILIEILLKKCDIESVNLWVQLTVQTFTTIINRILLKKVQRRKCDLLGPVDSLNNYISINRNFAQKV